MIRKHHKKERELSSVVERSPRTGKATGATPVASITKTAKV